MYKIGYIGSVTILTFRLHVYCVFKMKICRIWRSNCMQRKKKSINIYSNNQNYGIDLESNKNQQKYYFIM